MTPISERRYVLDDEHLAAAPAPGWRVDATYRWRLWTPCEGDPSFAKVDFPQAIVALEVPTLDPRFCFVAFPDGQTQVVFFSGRAVIVGMGAADVRKATPPVMRVRVSAEALEDAKTATPGAAWLAAVKAERAAMLADLERREDEALTAQAPLYQPSVPQQRFLDRIEELRAYRDEALRRRQDEEALRAEEQLAVLQARAREEEIIPVQVEEDGQRIWMVGRRAGKTLRLPPGMQFSSRQMSAALARARDAPGPADDKSVLERFFRELQAPLE